MRSSESMRNQVQVNKIHKEDNVQQQDDSCVRRSGMRQCWAITLAIKGAIFFMMFAWLYSEFHCDNEGCEVLNLPLLVWFGSLVQKALMVGMLVKVRVMGKVKVKEPVGVMEVLQ